MIRLSISFVLIFFVGSLYLKAQGLQIKGIIFGAEDSIALEGVSVKVKGTTIRTISGADGLYRITVPDQAGVLVFSYPGRLKKELPMAGLTVTDVVLEPDFNGMDQEYSTALGMNRRVKTLGYSFQGIDSEVISKANTSDFINAINGRLAGVHITSSSGMPGSSVYMTIRGPASLLGDNQPLVVLDGMPIVTGRGEMATTNRDPLTTGGTGSSSRSIDLNPEDIASLSVLNGGAATALYGMHAANGVVMITTKQGGMSAKPFQIDFHTSLGFDRVSQLPPRQNKFVQGRNYEWVSGYRDSWGPNADSMRYDRTDPDYKWDQNGMIVPADHPNASSIPVKMYDVYDFFQTGLIFNNRLSLSSGNDQSTYYFSIANLDQSGIMPNSSFGRTNVRLNASSRITRWFKIRTNMSYANSRAQQMQQGSNTSGVMMGLLRTPPSFDNAQGYEFPDGSQRNYRHGGGYDNPYWTVNKNHLDDRVNRFIGNTQLNFVFNEWFSASYNIGLDAYTRQTRDIIAVNSITAPEGSLEEGSFVSRQFNADLMLNFSKSFGSLHTDLVIGHNLFSSRWSDLFGDAAGLEIPGFYSLSNSSDNETGMKEENYRTSALFFDLQLGFEDILFLELTGRNEWSTTLPQKSNSAFYPSLNMGFIFTEIAGIRDNRFLSFGRIRGSVSITGNIASPYLTQNYYTTASSRDGWTDGVSFPWMGTSGLDVSDNMGNEVLGNETMASLEAGTDLGFFTNRIGINLSFFRNLNTGLILPVPVLNSFGYATLFKNTGEMETKGWELGLSAGILRGKLGWDLMMNWTKLSNKVLYLAPEIEFVALGGFNIPQSRAVVGQEYGVLYGNDWYRDNNEGTPTYGKILVNDDPNDAYRDSYPMTDTRQTVPLARVFPDWTAGIINTFYWNGLQLSFLLEIKRGGWMYNGTAYSMNDFGVHENTENREVYYTAEGGIDFDKTPEENIVVFEGVYGSFNSDGTPNSSGAPNVTPVVLDQEWFQRIWIKLWWWCPDSSDGTCRLGKAERTHP